MIYTLADSKSSFVPVKEANVYRALEAPHPGIEVASNEDRAPADEAIISEVAQRIPDVCYIIFASFMWHVAAIDMPDVLCVRGGVRPCKRAVYSSELGRIELYIGDRVMMVVLIGGRSHWCCAGVRDLILD